MKIGGFQKFSMIDFPDKLAAVIFTQGCNFRCPYCHNPELVEPALFGNLIDQTEILEFLKTRVGKLDGICITGGEPTLHEDLPELIEQLKSMGFLIKLDTNGSNPRLLAKLIKAELLDYIAMDIKAPLEKYQQVVAARVNLDNILLSIALIKNSGIEYEFRSTLVDRLFTGDEVLAMGHLLGKVKRYYFQNFVSSKALDSSYLKAQSIPQAKLDLLIRSLQKNITDLAVR